MVSINYRTKNNERTQQYFETTRSQYTRALARHVVHGEGLPVGELFYRVQMTDSEKDRMSRLTSSALQHRSQLYANSQNRTRNYLERTNGGNN